MTIPTFLRATVVFLLILWGAAPAPAARDDGIALFKEAQEQLRTARTPEALESALGKLERAVSLFKGTGDTRSEQEALTTVGIFFAKLGRDREALRTFESALTLARQRKDLEGEGALLARMGLASSRTGKAADAAKYWERALAAAMEIPDPRQRVRALEAIGVLFEERGRLNNAAEYAEKALDTARKIPDPGLEAAARNRLGSLYVKLGEYGKALSMHEPALVLMKKLNDANGEITTLSSIGEVYKESGEYAKALSSFGQAAELAKKKKNVSLEGAARNGIGLVHMAMGDYPKAVEALEVALVALRGSGSPERQDLVLINLGFLYRKRGQYAKAALALQKALELVRNENRVREETVVLQSLGDLYAAWGLHGHAMVYYEHALKLAKASTDRWEAAQNETRIAQSLGARGEFREALGHLTKAETLFRRAGSIPPELNETKAMLHLDLHEVAKAERYLTKGGTDASLGRLLLAKKQPEKAASHYESLRQSAEQTGKTDDAFTAYTGLGKSYEGLGQLDRAEEYYAKAMTTVEDLRSSLLPAARRDFFSVRVNGFGRADPARGLIRVKLKQDKGAESLVPSELIRARAFSDRLALGPDSGISGVPKEVLERDEALTFRLAALKEIRGCCGKKEDPKRWENLTKKIEETEQELNDFVEKLWKDYRPYAAVRYPRPLKLDELNLEGVGYILLYDLLEEGVGIKLLKGKEIVDALYVPWDGHDLAQTVGKFRSCFERVRLREFDVEAARRLYQKLLAPMLTKVPDGSPIVIIPDGVLALIPFEALVTDGTPRWRRGDRGDSVTGLTYVGDHHPISYAHSLTSLGLQAAARTEPIRDPRLLVIADPLFDLHETPGEGDPSPFTVAGTKPEQHSLLEAMVDESSGRFKFERLPETARLADELQRLYGSGTDTYTGARAAKSIFLKEIAPHLESYSQIIFATHGIYGTSVPGLLEPALALTVEPSQPDSFLRMTEIMSLKMNAEIVALTACQTGLGKEISGEGLMSMGRAFQFAGAQSVLMSLWSVEETASCLLVESFFKHLRAGKSTLAALSEARKEVRQAGYEHPFFWAPFIVVGPAN